MKQNSKYLSIWMKLEIYLARNLKILNYKLSRIKFLNFRYYQKSAYKLNLSLKKILRIINSKLKTFWNHLFTDWIKKQFQNLKVFLLIHLKISY